VAVRNMGRRRYNFEERIHGSLNYLSTNEFIRKLEDLNMKSNLRKSINVFLVALIYIILISKFILVAGILTILAAIAWGVLLFTKNNPFKSKK
jgi:hypothetical protein